MRPRIAALCLLLALPVASGCHLLDPDGGVGSEADAHFETWRAKGPKKYAYRVSQSCFCAPDYTAPYRVEVAGGKVVGVRNAETGAPPPSEYRARTVPELFDLIHEALDRDADRIEVEYEPTLGYPTTIFIDYEEQAADEELRIAAEGLEAIP